MFVASRGVLYWLSGLVTEGNGLTLSECELRGGFYSFCECLYCADGGVDVLLFLCLLTDVLIVRRLG